MKPSAGLEPATWLGLGVVPPAGSCQAPTSGRRAARPLRQPPTGPARVKAGTVRNYDMGRFGVSRHQIRIYDNLPDASRFNQILIGASFI